MNTKTQINGNFKLKFGKHKGEMFLNTPKSYQDWLKNQDWFNLNDNIQRYNNTGIDNGTVTYNVVRIYIKDYSNAMGISKQIEYENLSFSDAKSLCENMNMYDLNDITHCFFVEKSI
jgi:hypothetical protein